MAAVISAGPLLWRLRRSRRLGLVTPEANRYIWIALTAAVASGLLFSFSLIYETKLWPAVVSRVLLSIAALCLARVSHKGQRSDLYPRVIAMLLLPALIIPVFIWLPVMQPITWTLITLAYAAPALLIPYQRWVWMPLVLIGVAVISGWRSYRIRAELPKDEWITPIVSVNCDAGLRGVVADKG